MTKLPNASEEFRPIQRRTRRFTCGGRCRKSLEIRVNDILTTHRLPTSCIEMRRRSISIHSSASRRRRTPDTTVMTSQSFGETSRYSFTRLAWSLTITSPRDG
jgi:hypothetical protein